MHYGKDVVNSIFIKGLDTLVVVDTGVTEKKKILLDEIFKYDFAKLLIILSHAHPDHIGNNYALKEKYNPIFISNFYSKELLENYEYQFSRIVEQVEEYFNIDKNVKNFYFGLLDAEVNIDISFFNEMEINLGDRSLKLLHLPGHTIGDIGIMDKENKILILSELIFKHSRDMIIYIEDYNQYLNSLSKIEKLTSDNNLDMLITSHEEKPFNGTKNILEIINYNKEYIKRLKKDIENIYKKNKSIKDTAEEICALYSKSYTFDAVITSKNLLKNVNK